MYKIICSGAAIPSPDKNMLKFNNSIYILKFNQESTNVYDVFYMYINNKVVQIHGKHNLCDVFPYLHGFEAGFHLGVLRKQTHRFFGLEVESFFDALDQNLQ